MKDTSNLSVDLLTAFSVLCRDHVHDFCLKLAFRSATYLCLGGGSPTILVFRIASFQSRIRTGSVV